MIEPAKKEQSLKQTKRYIGKFQGNKKGPTLIFFGGIHGNEPAGVLALEHVFEKLNSGAFQIQGAIYGIRGNIPALLQGKRFLDHDLNRLWTTQQIIQIKSKPPSKQSAEEIELLKIEQEILEILNSHQTAFYFIDLHTTSSKTLPFITINDALINRKFSQLFPVPIILGIEEYLDGPLLSYMNQKGYASLGFESGQHSETASKDNNIAFLWLTMVFTGLIDKNDVSAFDFYYNQLSKAAKGNTDFYEVKHRELLINSDDFTMIRGFKSFQNVTKGTPLGIKNQKIIAAKNNTVLFMPLYQDQGAEAFFLIKQIPKWALNVSAFLRRTRFDKVLSYLPGISWSSSKKESLVVNLSIASLFTKSFFHLLGYRNKKVDETHILMSNRERTIKKEMYQSESWY